jgi:hypothetical protein
MFNDGEALAIGKQREQGGRVIGIFGKSRCVHGTPQIVGNISREAMGAMDSGDAVCWRVRRNQT